MRQPWGAGSTMSALQTGLGGAGRGHSQGEGEASGPPLFPPCPCPRLGPPWGL